MNSLNIECDDSVQNEARIFMLSFSYVATLKLKIAKFFLTS